MPCISCDAKGGPCPLGCPCECHPLKEVKEAREAIDHPPHYGGKDHPYETIKVIEAWDLDFHLGNTVKYISRAGRKSQQTMVQDLRKAKWYLDRLIELLEAKK